MWFLIALVFAGFVIFSFNQKDTPTAISIPFLKEQLKKGNVEYVQFEGYEGTGRFKEPPVAPKELNSKGDLVEQKDKVISEKVKDDGESEKGGFFSVSIPLWASEEERTDLANLVAEHTQPLPYKEPSDRSAVFVTFLSLLLPILLFVFLWSMFRRTRDQIMGGGFLSGFSKSPAKRYESTDAPITFKDVAGLDGVKADLQEMVDFLKDPEQFQRLGGRVPKGVLLNGPPGTGKTLLARAVAGEADVPFFTVSGSEFIQMFVGVGASRVRDLFQKAKEHSPAIIFIDEIDAVGRQRGAGLGGGHDEREQTLNQILSEMDGFTPTDSVIVIAATNRPDVLDPALLRPGRFDRHITVDRPTLKGRVEMFNVHVRDIPMGEDVDLKRLAEGSVGLTGADIRNLVNEAALWATRNGKSRVNMEDFEYARDKILMGPKREEVLLGEEKEKTAYHEAGHALLAWLTKGADRVHKVTVIPRGRALGVTQTLPEEDRMNISESELLDRLAFLLGGRAAEKLVFHEFSAGAENDLERATELARRMVTKWGMSDKLGPVSYKLSDEDPFLGREIHQQRQFSEHTLQIIDDEVARILHDAYDRSINILNESREKLDALATALVEREEVGEKDIVELIGPSVHHKKNGKPFVDKDESGELAAQDSGQL
ncbi:MAG: ATP-dependent zinc metalloprotease FtsH [Pirellulaceae bacterium]|nr:ATP-dependent zinc metalloprotease FtsH [Pirellulaceae bacterium]